ncbi:MAG: hypothetical protein AAFY59_01435 [Pseudomonadota bacterium]
MIPDQHPEFDDFLLRVGKLNYAWTNTESLLIHLIAGLCRTDKEAALIIFLTLNTTRARVDLVQRLAKMERTDQAERECILEITGGIQKLSGLRNRYNHCIYAFDPEGGSTRSILMRISDRKQSIKVGKVFELDAAAMDEIDAAISDLGEINRAIWKAVRDYRYPG